VEQRQTDLQNYQSMSLQV